jgi:hypothetical protein
MSFSGMTAEQAQKYKQWLDTTRLRTSKAGKSTRRRGGARPQGKQSAPAGTHVEEDLAFRIERGDDPVAVADDGDDQKADASQPEIPNAKFQT